MYIQFFPRNHILEMDFMLSLLMPAHTKKRVRLQGFHEILLPFGPHGSLEHVHLCAGIGRFSMKSVFQKLVSSEKFALNLIQF